MSFATLITDMTQAASRGEGAAVADCFTDDGTYHDVFYGAFHGRLAIIDMIENHFHRDGEDFRWDLHEPVETDEIGYARYVFSYVSKLPETAGRIGLFEGVSICRLRGGRIVEYREVANAIPGLHAMGFPAKRLVKLLAREADELATRPEAIGHFQR